MYKKKGRINSVVRNKIKRQIKYILRNIKSESYEAGSYLVILRTKCPLICYKELKNQLEFAVCRIKRKLKNEDN